MKNEKVLADMDLADGFMEMLNPDFFGIAYEGQRRSLANKGPGKTFDWNKAVQIIKETGATEIYAGLKEDWKYTGGKILSDGKPTERSCQCLASSWATPVLVRDGQEIECWVEIGKDKVDTNVWWPADLVNQFD